MYHSFARTALIGLATLALTACATSPTPLADAASKDAQAERVASARWLDNFLRQLWTPESFEVQQRSRLDEAQRRHAMALLTRPMTYPGAACQAGELLEVRHAARDAVNGEIWRTRVCALVVETDVQALLRSASKDAGVETADGTAQDGYVTARQFRRDHPAPTNLTAFLAVYRQAGALLLERARRGLRSDVRLVDAAGTISVGYDEYFSGQPQRFHEVRDQRESVIVGKVHCARAPGAAYRCQPIDLDDDYTFGLRKLAPDGIVTVDESAATCAGLPCTAFRIRQVRVEERAGEYFVRADPDADFHDYTLQVRADGAPFSLHEVHRVDGRSSGVEATYRYNYDAGVAPFDLPPH